MTRTLVAVAMCSISISACAISGNAEVQSPEDVAVAPARAKPARKARKKPAGEAVAAAGAEQAGSVRPRQVGDYFVHRFSGSFRKNPITLTEEVVAREGGLLVVEYTFEDSEQTLRVRARIDENTGKAVAASTLEKDKEVEMSLAAFEALIAETLVVADSNEGRVSTEKITCLVGTDEHDCETTSYAVSIGGKKAVLKVTSSESLPDRDVSGEVTAADGTLIYRAEIIEAGNSESSADSVAIGK
jgi:hypothetical protein